MKNCINKKSQLATEKQFVLHHSLKINKRGVLVSSGEIKVHRAITDVSPSFRSTLSAIGTPSYKPAKFLVLSSLQLRLINLQIYCERLLCFC